MAPSENEFSNPELQPLKIRVKRDSADHMLVLMVSSDITIPTTCIDWTSPAVMGDQTQITQRDPDGEHGDPTSTFICELNCNHRL